MRDVRGSARQAEYVNNAQGDAWGGDVVVVGDWEREGWWCRSSWALARCRCVSDAAAWGDVGWGEEILPMPCRERNFNMSLQSHVLFYKKCKLFIFMTIPLSLPFGKWLLRWCWYVNWIDKVFLEVCNQGVCFREAQTAYMSTILTVSCILFYNEDIFILSTS